MTDFAKFGLKVCFEGWEILREKLKVGEAELTFNFFCPFYPDLWSILWKPNFPKSITSKTSLWSIPKILSAIDNHQQSDDSHYKPADFLSKILINVNCFLLQSTTIGRRTSCSTCLTEKSEFGDLNWKYVWTKSSKLPTHIADDERFCLFWATQQLETHQYYDPIISRIKFWWISFSGTFFWPASEK